MAPRHRRRRPGDDRGGHGSRSVRPRVVEHPSSRKAKSIANLKRIGKAILEYEAAHGRLPGYIRAVDGTPFLSWRVALLPDLGERALYDEFRLDEPWDSSHNKALLGRMPTVFALPGAGPRRG